MNNTSPIVYLDNAATTKPKYFAKDYSEIWLNSNAPYAHNEINQINEARHRIKLCLGAKSGKILIGGTASQLVDRMFSEMGLLDSRYDNDEVICSLYEHNSVNVWGNSHVKTIKKLKNKLEYLSDQKKRPLKNIYVCWMHTNNVTGKIFPVKEIGELCHEYGAYFICDMTASISHVDAPEGIDQWCDCCFASAHKWHGEKGIGFAYVSDRISKHIGLNDDSHEEYGFIPGTLNVPGVIAMSYAMQDACQNIPNKEGYWKVYARYLVNSLNKQGIEAKLYESENKTYAINALTLPQINADALQQYLASKRVYVGLGHSACAEMADYRVLKAFGFTQEMASHTIRVSFDYETSLNDVDALLNHIVDFQRIFC